MNTANYSFLYNDELTVLELRRLYESCGFKKFSMSKFESYDFYARNKDFLVSKSIITFSDLNGKLMALKPDVTLSIVKNADRNEKRQKLYYTENVYRESKEIHEIKEIFQVGLEVLGDIDLYESFEIVSLAVKSLLTIDENAVLTLSHMGYTEGAMDCIATDKKIRQEVHDLIKSKNAHDLLKLANANSLPLNPINVISDIMTSVSDNEGSIKKAKAYALNSKMLDAVNEIEALYDLLKSSGLHRHIKIDFSVTDDPNYYNGILMHGYVTSIARDVLSGGRYDMLMSKMGKKNSNAMGFAIYFDALNRKLHTREKEDSVYIIYDDTASGEKLIELTEKLRSENKCYNALTALPENAKGTVYYISGDDVKEEKI